MSIDCEIRVLGWFLYLCNRDSHAFDSESFELELNGSAWDTSALWLAFRPNPFSGFEDQVSPHVHHERTTLTKAPRWAGEAEVLVPTNFWITRSRIEFGHAAGERVV